MTLTAGQQRSVNLTINRLLNAAEAAEDLLVGDVIAELGRLQGDIRQLLIDEAGTPYAKVLTELDRRVAVRAAALTERLSAGITSAADLGVGLVDGALSAADVAAVTEISPAQRVASRVTTHATRLVYRAADLVRIGTSHQLLLIDAGDLDLAGALQAVGSDLAGSRVFGRPAATVASIARTEAGSAHGAGHQLRLEQAAQLYDGLAKRWISLHGPTARPRHEVVESRGAIPADATFVVGRYRATHPRGPGLPGVEKLNCRCRAIPVLDELSAPAPAAAAA